MSAVWFVWLPLHGGTSAGPAWSSLAQDLHCSGRHESSIRIYLPPPPPRNIGVRGASIVRMWTLVLGWPQLGLIWPVRFPLWSTYILGSGVELN